MKLRYLRAGRGEWMSGRKFFSNRMGKMEILTSALRYVRLSFLKKKNSTPKGALFTTT